MLQMPKFFQQPNRETKEGETQRKIWKTLACDSSKPEFNKTSNKASGAVDVNAAYNIQTDKKREACYS
jgi:hypothetical protein